MTYQVEHDGIPVTVPDAYFSRWLPSAREELRACVVRLAAKSPTLESVTVIRATQKDNGHFTFNWTYTLRPSTIPFSPTCEECGDHFEPTHIGQSFCTDSCAEIYSQRLHPTKENR